MIWPVQKRVDLMIRAGLLGRRAAVLLVITIAAATVTVVGQRSSKRPYFPGRGEWQTKDLSVAIVNQFRSEAPFNTLIGPTQPRAGSNGVIVRHGVVAAEWGDTSRADMTFSVTKTFLSTVVGLAFDRGQIRDVTDRVATYTPAGVELFTAEHNAPITWEHLLRQTSDW